MIACKPKLLIRRKTAAGVINSYLPDRSRKGGNALDDLIRQLADNLLIKLDELEKETNFDYLLNVSEPDLKDEALLLHQEIRNLKNILLNL